MKPRPLQICFLDLTPEEMLLCVFFYHFLIFQLLHENPDIIMNLFGRYLFMCFYTSFVKKSRVIKFSTLNHQLHTLKAIIMKVITYKEYMVILMLLDNFLMLSLLLVSHMNITIGIISMLGLESFYTKI